MRNNTQASATRDRISPPSAFSGHTVVFTGKLASLNRRDARAVVKRLGGAVDDDVTMRTTMLVIGSENAEPVAPRTDEVRAPGPALSDGRSNKLKKAEAVNQKVSGHIQIIIEDDFCRLAAVRSNQSLSRRYHSLRQVRERYPLIRENHLRYLEKWSLVRPVARSNTDTFYGFGDVAVLKQVHDELRRNVSFRSAVRRSLADREGQLTLDFSSVRGDARPAKVVALRRREATKVAVTLAAAGTGGVEGDPSAQTQSALAVRFFLEGSELDEGGEGERERARMAYRKALLLDPNLVPAIVNLANLHYANDDLVEAQALYGRALLLEPECFEAHFNLGNIHHDLGRYQEAIGYYLDALRLNPPYADAHFYLAVTLEKMGRSQEAKAHWRAYQQLAPDGEWVDLAKEFSE